MKELILFNIKRCFKNKITIVLNILLFVICILVVNMDLFVKESNPAVIYLDSSMEKYHLAFEEIYHDEFNYLLKLNDGEKPVLCYEDGYVLISDDHIGDETMQMIKEDIIRILIMNKTPEAGEYLEITLTQRNPDLSAKKIILILLSIAYLLVTTFGTRVGSEIIYERNNHILDMILTNTSVRNHLMSKIISAYIIPTIQLMIIFIMIFVNIIVRICVMGMPDLNSIIEEIQVKDYATILSIEPLRLIAIVLIFISSLVLIQILVLIIMSGISNSEENIAVNSIVSIGTMIIYAVLMILSENDFFFGITARILSFIPLLSPFIMCCRIAIKSAGIIDVAIGLIINILTLMYVFKWLLPIYQKKLFSNGG